MVNTQLKILRVFGPTGAEVSSVLRQIRDDGCPGLRLLERDGEFAICVQVSAPNRAMAEQYCDKWAARLRAKFGDDVFAEGETSLAQATLDALLDKRKLLVAVDETTGRLLGALLQPLAHSEAVFDFGTESYADPQKARRIAVPEQLLKRFPGDVVQAAAGRALAAMQVTGADYAAAYMPASVGQCPFVLVCDRGLRPAARYERHIHRQPDFGSAAPPPVRLAADRLLHHLPPRARPAAACRVGGRQEPRQYGPVLAAPPHAAHPRRRPYGGF